MQTIWSPCWAEAVVDHLPLTLTMWIADVFQTKSYSGFSYLMLVSVVRVKVSEQLSTEKSSISSAAMTRRCRTWCDDVWLVMVVVLVPGESGAQTKTGVHIPLNVTLHMISMWSETSTALSGRLMFVPHTGADSEQHNRCLYNFYQDSCYSFIRAGLQVRSWYVKRTLKMPTPIRSRV